jgi:hypothetical protein
MAKQFGYYYVITERGKDFLFDEDPNIENSLENIKTQQILQFVDDEGVVEVNKLKNYISSIGGYSDSAPIMHNENKNYYTDPYSIIDKLLSKNYLTSVSHSGVSKGVNFNDWRRDDAYNDVVKNRHQEVWSKKTGKLMTTEEILEDKDNNAGYIKWVGND